MWTLLLALILDQGQTISTATIFEQASRALSQGDYAAARRGFEQVLRREPGNPGVLGNLGVVYSRLDQPARAIEFYRRALALLPGDAGLKLNLGLAHMKLDQYVAAKPLFAGLSTTQGRELHAICQLQTGELEAATASLESLAAGPSASPAVLHFLALAYVRKQNLPRAEQIFQQLMARLPEAEAQFLEGRVWYEATIFDRALECYRRATVRNASLPGLSREMGKTLISLRNFEEAETALREALQQDEANLETRYFLGALLVQQGRPAEGVSLLEAVKTSRPDLWGTSYYLGKARLALGNSTAALPLLQEAARRAPNEAPVQYQLARTYQSLGRKQEAAAAFARVARLQSAANAESIVMK